MGRDCDSQGSPYDDFREGRDERERGERGRQAGRERRCSGEGGGSLRVGGGGRGVIRKREETKALGLPHSGSHTVESRPPYLDKSGQRP